MKQTYWHYFVSLCEDAEKTTRFVEPTPDNFNTYSIEYARLYLAIGSEVDVVAKLLCEKIKPTAKVKNIDDYRPVILAAFPDLPAVQVVVPRHEISFTPWLGWQTGVNPLWWTKHNAVKHARHKSFKEANLENTLNALGGLLVLVGYFYSEDLVTCWLSPSPSGILMQFDRKYFSGISMGNRGSVVGYCLPGIAKPKHLQHAARQLESRT
jgi:hypothetical protein